MMVVLPAVLTMAEAQSAMLSPGGSVKVNGKALARTVAVFAGDTLQTEASPATIAAHGSTVYVPGDSQVTFRGNAVDVVEGGVLVTTSRRMTAEVGGFTVAPVETSARFEIARLNGVIQVAAHEGALAISRGEKTTMLEAGKAAIYDPAATSSAQDDDDDWKVLWIAAGAIGVAALVAYFTTRNSPSSPILP